MWAIRITPYNEKITINEVQQLIEQYTQKYVIGHETEKNDHFHIVSDVKIENQKLYDLLGNGFIGNKVISQKEVIDLDKAVSYAVKDGDIVIGDDSDRWENYVKQRQEESFKKPKSYEIQFKKLIEQFQNDEIDEKDLWKEIIKVRTYFNLRVNLFHIDELVLSQMFKKYPELLDIEVEKRKIFS